MPGTPKYGFPYESPPFATPSGEPGETLHGGSSGTSDILAEKVEEELDRVETDVQDLLLRVTALEEGTSGKGWIAIASGFGSGESFSIDLTDGGRFSPGEFALIRLHMRFDLDAGAGWIAARINNDSAGNNYRTGSTVFNKDLTVTEEHHSAESSLWRIGHGSTLSTSSLICTFFHMNGNVLHTFQSTSNRQSDNPSVHRWSLHWGALRSHLSEVPSSIMIGPVAPAAEIVAAWWWIEGFRVS